MHEYLSLCVLHPVRNWSTMKHVILCENVLKRHNTVVLALNEEFIHQEQVYSYTYFTGRRGTVLRVSWSLVFNWLPTLFSIFSFHSTFSMCRTLYIKRGCIFLSHTSWCNVCSRIFSSVFGFVSANIWHKITLAFEPSGLGFGRYSPPNNFSSALYRLPKVRQAMRKKFRRSTVVDTHRNDGNCSGTRVRSTPN